MIELMLMGSGLKRPVSKGVIRRLRVVLLESAQQSYVGIVELQLFDKNGVNQAVGSNVSVVASSFYSSTWGTHFLNDNLINTNYWCSNTGNNANLNRTCWIEYRFSEPVDIESLVLHPFTHYRPRRFDVEISKDNITYQKIGNTFITGYNDGGTVPPFTARLT